MQFRVIRAPSERVTGPSVWLTESPLVTPTLQENHFVIVEMYRRSFQPEKKNKTYLLSQENEKSFYNKMLLTKY